MLEKIRKRKNHIVKVKLFISCLTLIVHWRQITPNQQTRNKFIQKERNHTNIGSRNESIADINTSNGEVVDKTISEKSKSRSDNLSNKRNSWESLKIINKYLWNPSARLYGSSKIQACRSKQNTKRRSWEYVSPFNDTTNQSPNWGEYSYGRGGWKFTKWEKISKFDEWNKSIWSPGPAKYSPTANQKSSVFSFGKQKKEFSFVKTKNDIPSPGKYKVKRDFISKQSNKMK